MSSSTATPNGEPGDDASAPLPPVPLVLPLAAVGVGMLSAVGGKATALGGLLRAGFPVPNGFCVTTAAYDLVTQAAGVGPLLEALAGTPSGASADAARLGHQASRIRAALLAATLPDPVVAAIDEAMRTLVGVSGASAPLAVRSSATAEDLPWASFAGQQETFLNVVGVEAVRGAIQRCFASLWTDRAVTYRANLAIDPRTVRLAVLVQRLVEPVTAGVLFSANPLTGNRHQMVIEANPGLGEAVVSGATTPDHFVVARHSGAIVERRLGDKRLVIIPKPGGGTEQIERSAGDAEPCLSDDEVRTLAELGASVEAHVGAPQDLEWALDGDGRCWLLQARPITTLYPLPPEAPASEEALRVYLCFGVQQGITRPFTPMGIAAIRLLISGMTTLMGLPPADRLRGPRFISEAGSRIFLDVTQALRSAFGRRLLVQMMAEAEVRAAAGFRQLADDPRLTLLPTRRGRIVRSVVHLMVRTRLPWYLLQALLVPRIARARVRRLMSRVRRGRRLPANTPASAHLHAAERLLFRDAPRLLPRISPVMVAGMQAFAMARHLLGDLATEEECQVVLRGSPDNSTVEMNLALWALAEQARGAPEVARLVRETPPADLAAAYQAGQLPSRLQRGLAAFLSRWGLHATADLDLGVLRWSEEPTAVLALLAGYLGSGNSASRGDATGVERSAQSPKRQIERLRREAKAMVRTLARRARKRGWLRGWVVGFCLRRARALAGSREATRLAAALLLTRARTHLWAVGHEAARAGWLERIDDIFFLTLAEAGEALGQQSAGSSATGGRAHWRALVAERRARYTEELARRHVPLLLLSDGTEPTSHDQPALPSMDRLEGAAASPGVATGRARVVRDPAGAHLEPGEILIAPSTDPSWTPLFLVAGGLVMELGGAMAHGAIVAREYGLPAVVGVRGATERIVTGQRITVDGTAGVVVLEPREGE